PSFVSQLEKGGGRGGRVGDNAQGFHPGDREGRRTGNSEDGGRREGDRIGGPERSEAECGTNEAVVEKVYSKELTVAVDIQGEEVVTPLELMKSVRELCGGILACRCKNVRSYEITMSHPVGKRRLLDGLKIGNTQVLAKEITNDELVVSFLELPAYIKDEEIVAKLHGWGVAATSPIKRRMWPGTSIADGTRFMKVRFTDKIQSLPYSTKFSTAAGSEYFRVIHDRQAQVCRLCIQPGHIFRECPDFLCRKCGQQGHYARECQSRLRRCEICHNKEENCICNYSDGQEEEEEEKLGGEPSAGDPEERGEEERSKTEDGEEDEEEDQLVTIDREVGIGSSLDTASVSLSLQKWCTSATIIIGDWNAVVEKGDVGINNKYRSDVSRKEILNLMAEEDL
uniref:CCHC-type domain-containing protein n=1 Tax=Mastacembelus armatus TaxID=205130 RepID=A0A7N8YRP8_9TELE